VPFSCAIWFDKLHPWDAKMSESIPMGGVLFKPAYPEDLNLLSPGSASDLLCPFVVDGDREDVDESAVSIRVGVIMVRGSNHEIRSCTEVDDV
jgi:hypothetical protein